MIRQIPIRHILQIIVVRILRHPTVHERPRQVIHRVLLVLDGPRDNLRVEGVVQEMIQMRFDRQRIQQEFQEKLLLGRLAHQHANGLLVDQRAIGETANHLDDVSDGVILVRVDPPVVRLRVHDDDQVGLDVDRPAEILGHHQNLDGVQAKESLHVLPVPFFEALVEETNALRQGMFLQGLQKVISTKIK